MRLTRNRVLRNRIVIAVIAVMAGLASLVSGAPEARAQILANETFRFSTVGAGWTLSSSRLTGGSTGTGNPVSSDTNGNGWLRLTENNGNDVGSAVFNTAVSSAAGIRVSFDFVSWGGSGADGISFFLVDGTQNPPAPGAYGGSLGYAQRTGIDGAPNGYIGIALDEFGNFANPTEGRNGGTAFTPDAVTVRGAGNGQTGYAFLTTTGTLSPGLDFPSVGTRPDQSGAGFQRCTIIISPAPNPRLTVRLSRGAGSNPVTVINNFDIIGAGNPQPPATYKFGFAASTGGSTNVHEIRNFVVTTATGAGVANVLGRVYEDTNHNSNWDGGESSTGIANLFVKRIAAAGGNALEATPVNTSTGRYQFTDVPDGNYILILDNNDDLTDTTAYQPPGYISTEAPFGRRSITVLGSGFNTFPNENFGLYRGSRIDGTVFKDDGAGGGTANNGVRDGGETGIGGVTVKATDNGGATTYSQIVTGANGTYSVYIPYTASGTVKIVETNQTSYVSTGGDDVVVSTSPPATPDTATGGSYNRPTDTFSFTFASGNIYQGINFGDVPPNTLTYSGNKITTPGGIAEFPHVFTPGTAGSVLFTSTHLPTPNIPGWSSLIYRDANQNGIADNGEAQITGTINTTPGVPIYLVVRVYAPANAAPGNNDITTLTAQFTYTGASPALSQTLTQTDTTTVQANSGLQLSKAVDRATAKKGDILTYTITYSNNSSGPISNIVIYDTTPAFTTFVGQSHGPLPNNISSISANVTGGTIRWTLSGALLPAQSGTVSFQVQLQ